MSETIVFIHGMWGTGALWEQYKGHFAERGYTCLTPTLRHHAAHPRDAPDPAVGSTSLLDYAADLEAELRALPHPPIIIGHSMGGLLAQMLAARGLARAVVLLTPAAPAGILAIRWSVLKSFRSGLLRWAFWRKPYRQTYEEAVYSMMQHLPEPARRAAYDKFVFESGRAAAEIGFWPFDPRHAARVDASRIACPMLVVGAADDRITPPGIVRKVWRKYRRVADYKEFQGHAHWVIAEPGWQEIAQYCADWLVAKAPPEQAGAA